ncbi:hypothetical protein GJAV_G00056650 [Gymnothorax javanicus]|nr:hypothetical protein GJAV_G00056650 [Gymnothorax javanicus]
MAFHYLLAMSFRTNCQRTWIRALNEQACRRTQSSIQISFENHNLQLPPSASIDQVTCMDQSAGTMMLRCDCTVGTVTFPVTVTQQSQVAVSVDTYQVTIAPTQVQLMVSLEEVEGEGLLVSWSFLQPPLLCLAVSLNKEQQEGMEKVDVNVIGNLVENAIVSTHPAMVVYLKACEDPESPEKTPDIGRRSASPSTPVQRMIVSQLRVTRLLGRGDQVHEVCCALDLDPPTQEARSEFLPAPVRPGVELEWNEDMAFNLDANTKGLRVRLVHRNCMGEEFLSGHGSVPLDFPRKPPTGQQVLSVSPGPGLPPIATVILELAFLEADDSHCDTQPSALPSSSLEAGTDNDQIMNCKMAVLASATPTPILDGKAVTGSSCSPHRVKREKIALLREPLETSCPTSSLEVLLSNDFNPMDDTAIGKLIAKQTSAKRATNIVNAESKGSMAVGESRGTSLAETDQQKEHSQRGNNSKGSGSPRVVWQDCDKAARPPPDDQGSESGSTGALETRSLKDHKVGFLRSGTKLLFRKRAQQKDPSLSRSHEDVSNLGHICVTGKKSGSLSRRLIKRFSFHSRTKNKTGRGVDNKGPKMKMAKEIEEPTMFGESPPMKKKHSMSDKSPALNSFDVFQAFVADANREVDALFSKFAEVMSERAAVDGSQIRELEDMVKEVKTLESHLMERKEQLRRSLAAISDKLQE